MSKLKKSKKLIFITVIFVVVAVVSASLAFFSAMRATPPVEVGLILPLSGEARVYGESIRRGVDLARAESGLTNVNLIYKDTGCDSDMAEEGMREFAEMENVVAVIGEACSGATLAAVPVADESQLVLISPASTVPELSGSSDYFFRTVPSDEEQGRFGAELVYENGHRELAILYSNEEYGTSFRDVLLRNFEELGGDVVAQEHFDRNDNDLREQLSRISDSNPDAIYIISNSMTPSVAALRQIGELDIEPAVFGSEAFKSEDILRRAGEHAEGLVVSAVSMGSPDFVARYNEHFGHNPGSFAAQGYDAFMALARVIQDGAHTPSDIQEALLNVSFMGSHTFISFNEKGDVAGGYDVYVVGDGQFIIQ